MDLTFRKRLKQAAVGGASALVLAGMLVSHYEGRRYTPYQDTGGVWTVCEGITGPDVIRNKTYTDLECNTLRDKHLKVAQDAVHRQIKVRLNPWQEAGLIDFTFNLGEPKLASSTMKAEFNAGNYLAGCAQLVRWVKGRVRGTLVTLNGLVKRRADEQALCEGTL